MQGEEAADPEQPRSGGGAGLCVLVHKCTLTTGGLHLSAGVENNLGELEVCRGFGQQGSVWKRTAAL